MTREVRDPSALLAELAARVHSWERDGLLEPDWLSLAEHALEDAARRCAVRRLSLEFRRAKALKVLRDTGAPTFEAFVKATEALQRLDEWHRPLDRVSHAGTRLDDAQERALERLVVEGRGYNPPGPFGTLIPAAADVGTVRPPRTGVVAQLLHFTAYLPAMVAAGDPDDSTAPSGRQVELHYVASSPRSGDSRGAVGDRPVVAVAPVLQDMADAMVEVRTSPDRYGVRVLYDPARLERIVTAAVEGGAHLLFMPEMAVDVDRVADLASAVRRVASARRRATGALPQLRFVVAGLAHASGDAGNNSIVVLDVEGRRVMEQDKLCRWNLRWYHQRNYGIVPSCAPHAPDLREDIPGGGRVFVADLGHLGRFLTLICADMDYDRPGDWLVSNVSIDWLHAPIMDKSIGWYLDAGGELQPWIVRRARRAAENGVPKVVVTNSVLLTLRLNEYNAEFPDPDHPVLRRCAIAFMLDSSDGTHVFRQLEAQLPCLDTIVECVEWLDGFAAFPPPGP